MNLYFKKMNGLGNDFVVIDARQGKVVLSAEEIRALADRNNPLTKGCDQIILIEPAREGVFMRIYNADGGEVESCGNAARCVAWLVMEEQSVNTIEIDTRGGMLQAARAGDHRVTVDMGPARWAHKDIPIAASMDIMNIELHGMRGVAVGMGNPHIVFFVDDVAAIDLAKIGPDIENRTDIFPKRVNVSITSLIPNPQSLTPHLKVRTWERGAGLTLACGTAACAVYAVAQKLGKIGETAEIHMPGGALELTQDARGHILMTGAVEGDEEFMPYPLANQARPA